MAFCNREPIEIDTACAPIIRTRFYVFLGVEASANAQAWKAAHSIVADDLHTIFLADNACDAIRQVIFYATYLILVFLNATEGTEFMWSTLSMFSDYMQPDARFEEYRATCLLPREIANMRLEVYRTFAEVPEDVSPMRARWGSMTEFARIIRNAICTSNACADDPTARVVGDAQAAFRIERDEAHDTQDEIAFRIICRNAILHE